MSILFRTIEPHDHEHVRKLLSDLGWEARVRDPARFAQMLRGSNRALVALDGDRIVGFARALFDGASNGYISTVAVAADRQRQGIGRELTMRLMTFDKPERITWVLRSTRGGHAFWEKLGFRSSDVAMERVRSE